MTADAQLAAEAAEALQLAALDPSEARTRSQAVLDRARGSGAWAAVSTVERALGVAAMNMSEIDVAIGHLRAAVSAGNRARSPEAVGQARMSLASALVLRGLPTQAAREIAAAVRDLDGVARARAGVQQAAIQQELGQDDAALESVRRALPTLRRAGDAEWAARALSNRSLIHATRRAFGAAESDLIEARRLCDEQDLQLPAAYAEQNLGCVKAQRGDIPTSLRYFDAAQERYERFGVVEASLLLDRAGVLLSVRLLDEARESAEAAVAAYTGQRREIHLPDAQLLLATVALLQRDIETSRTAASDAVAGFRRLGRTQGLALARYAVLQADAAAGLDRVSPARLARAADELERVGWAVPALEARVLAGRVALKQGRRQSARRQLALAGAGRSAGPADARARAWLAEALLRLTDGRRKAADAALRAGLRIVEEHQATLGATELRAHVSVHRGALAGWGLRMALEDSSARRALWWAEHHRATALSSRPAQPPEDPELALDLADLRSTMQQIEQVRGDGDTTHALVTRQVALERRIRDRCRTLNAAGDSRGHRSKELVAGLVASLGDAALVEYVESDETLHAITVVRGRVRLHALGRLDDIRRDLTFVPFALRRLARLPTGSSGANAQAATALLRDAAGRFDDLLLRPLQAEIGDRPLVVVPTGPLQALPWSLLPSCAGRPVSVSPSAGAWLEAVTRKAPDVDGRVVVVAGPGLPGALSEAADVAALYPGSVLLTGDAANAAAVAEESNGAAVLHLAAHGTLRSDNPLFSALTLADGPFTIYEIERLSHSPRHVILAACDTGRHHVVASDEVLGFGAALLGGGSSTVVAPVVAIPDSSTVPLMRAYHRGLIRGYRPAEALADAQAGIQAADTAQWAAAAGFVCLGAG